MIEKEVIGEGSQQDIGIDKAYNILTIDVPKQEVDYSDNSIWTYITNNFAPLINNINIDKQKLGQAEIPKFIDLYYKTIAIDYLARLLTEEQSLLEIKELLNSSSPPYISYGVQPATVSSIVLEKKLQDSAKFQITQNQFSAKSKRGTDWALALKGGTDNEYSEISTLISNDFPTSLGDVLAPNINNVSSRLYSNVLSMPLFFNGLGIILDNKLRNYSVTEMFKGVFKNPDNKFVYDDGARQDNLLRKAKLVGVRVVKSLEPLDPEENINPDSVIQTFHIPLQLEEKSQQIRLFDSQIVYGTTYYYTAYGIYVVDGKYYFYDNMNLEILDAKFETKIVEEKGIIDNVEKTGPDNFEFINPCCKFSNENLGKNIDIMPLFIGQQGVSIGAKSEFEASKKFWDKSVKGNETDAAIVKALKLQPYDATIAGLNNWKFFNDPDNSSLAELLIDLYRKENAPSVYNYFASYKFNVEQTINQYKSFNVNFTEEQAKELIADRNQLVCFLCSRRGSDPKNKIPSPARLIQTRLAQNSSLFNKAVGGKFLGGLIDCRDFGYAQKDGFTGFADLTEQESNNLIGDNNPKVRNFNPTKIGAANVKYKCKIFDTISKKKVTNQIEPEKFKQFSFEIKESNAATIYDIPLGPSVKSSVIDVVPVPPVVTFVPLADVNNKIKIKFQESVQSDFQSIVADDACVEKNGPAVIEKLIEQHDPLWAKGFIPERDIGFPKTKIVSRSQNDLFSIIALKLDRRPDSLQDLVENAEEFVLNFADGKTTYLSNLVPNQKYYYAFLSRDITGLYSNATETYEVELVEDSGFTYASIAPYFYEQKQERQTEKTFQKLLKIKPSFEEMLPNNAERIGTSDLYSVVTAKTSDTTAEHPPRFKIRIRSKKTKRMFDINLKFTQKITEITSGRLLKQLKKVSDLIDEVETD